jgi:hypothetical protein
LIRSIQNLVQFYTKCMKNLDYKIYSIHNIQTCKNISYTVACNVLNKWKKLLFNLKVNSMVNNFLSLEIFRFEIGYCNTEKVESCNKCTSAELSH